jgi:Nose resistant-to-fluoxetine protein, N-terminal domain
MPTLHYFIIQIFIICIFILTIKSHSIDIFNLINKYALKEIISLPNHFLQTLVFKIFSTNNISLKCQKISKYYIENPFEVTYLKCKSNYLCINQNLMYFIHAQVLDSGGVISPGVLELDFSPIGNYDECLSIQDELSENIHFLGTYCSVEIIVCKIFIVIIFLLISI